MPKYRQQKAEENGWWI